MLKDWHLRRPQDANKPSHMPGRRAWLTFMIALALN
jgi:hypothetical protein